MPRSIVRYRGKGEKPAPDVERLRRLKDAKVVDDSAPRMLLIDGPDDVIRASVEALPDWVLAQERTYGAPRPSPVLEKTKELKPPK